MADRQVGYGMTAELKEKQDGKYDAEQARQAMDWIQSYVPDSNTAGLSSSSDVHEKLKDGVVLCNLINSLNAKSAIKVNSSKMAFKQMENIGKFLDACYDFGVAKNDMFQTVDLYEATNMPQVITSIHALGRKAGSKGFRGLGPKESTKNERQFSDQQLRAGEGVIGLQMGSNKGATQAGQNFGKTRAIID